jgi:hypothetical protein
MDELFDLADAFGLLSGVSDYFSSAPELIEAFSDLNLEEMDMWNESTTDFFENLSGVEQGEFLSGLDADALEVSTSFSPEFLDPAEIEFTSGFIYQQDIALNLHEAFTEIPEPFKEYLGEVRWTPEYYPEDHRIAGLWSVDSTTGMPSIKMYDYAYNAEATLYHEIGHHISRIHPDFFDQFSGIALENPEIFSYEADHLNEYDPSVWVNELFAQVIMNYNTQSEILESESPEFFTLVHNWWQAALKAPVA